MSKKLTTEERTTIETLIKMGFENKHIADITRRSISVIGKLRNGTYDMLNERKRVAEREKKKKEKAEEIRAVKDALKGIVQENEYNQVLQNLPTGEKEKQITLGNIAIRLVEISRILKAIGQHMGVEFGNNGANSND